MSRLIQLGFRSDIERMDWLYAFRKVIISYHFMQEPQLHSTKQQYGWQYLYLYTQSYTMAVTTETDPYLHTVTHQQLYNLDLYNGYCPFHDAAKLNHVPAIHALLQAGTDPNIVSSDKVQTPMYIAIRDQLPQTTIDISKHYGAQQSTHETMEEAIFRKMSITQRIVGTKREKQKLEQEYVQKEKDEQRNKAGALTQEMNNNLRKLQDRGEQINEIHDKAYNLNHDANEYQSMAKQLKVKMMNKKWYHLR